MTDGSSRESVTGKVPERLKASALLSSESGDTCVCASNDKR